MQVIRQFARPKEQSAPGGTDSADGMADMIMEGYQALAASVITLGRVRESKAELQRRIVSLGDTIAVSRGIVETILRRRMGDV